MLAEILGDDGYHCYSSQWHGAWFQRGNRETMFDDVGYDDWNHPYLLAEKVVDWGLNRIDSSPWFLLLHFFDVHWPYYAPFKYADKFYEGDDPFKGNINKIRGSFYHRSWMNFLEYSRGVQDVDYMFAQYDGEINYADEQIGRILKQVPEDTVVVLTSDHGENLGENQFYFTHYGMWEHIINVPLIIYAPWLGKAVRTEFCEHVDLLPTILSLLDISPEESFDGVNLFDGDFEGKRQVYAMELRLRKAQCVRDARFKLVRVEKEGRFDYELYDFRLNPQEKINFAFMNMPKVWEMNELLDKKMG